MKQIQKLDSLIKKIIKEELEEKKVFVTKDGKTLTPAQQQELQKTPSGETIEIKTQGQKEATEEEVANTEVLENEVKASDIAGQVSEIVDKLKTMAEAKEDPKKQRLAEKAMKQMESAKAALEALTAHEMMLEEKAQAEEEKEAEKHVGKFKKALTKLVKEPAAVEKISAKMTPQKMADLKRKMKSGELDEEKLARVMLQHSLKEGWIK
jgi:predicted RNA-binding protein